MDTINNKLYDINQNICKNLDLISKENRGFISQNLLAQFRTLVEILAVKYYMKYTRRNLSYNWMVIKKATEYLKRNPKLIFLNKFHSCLQITESHYIQTEDGSERLMLQYFEYLLEIKQFVKNEDNIDILNNLYKYPMDIDPKLKDYYSKINYLFSLHENYVPFSNSKSQRCYVQKFTPIFVNDGLIYEVVLTPADDNISKFDRVIAFTKYKLLTNYAIKADIIQDKIDVIENEMPISLIMGWESSIRPCEFNNFSRLIGIKTDLKSNNSEYKNIMKILTLNKINLLDMVQLDQCFFEEYMREISLSVRKVEYIDVLNKCRNIILNDISGANVIRYLLYIMNNRVLKKQYGVENDNLSKMYLDYGCIPFDKMPFVTSLKAHNPRMYDLIRCIDFKNYEYQFLARDIKINTENNGVLYTDKSELSNFKQIDNLVLQYNSKLYYKHTHRKLLEYKDYLYINQYEKDAIFIINKILELSNSGIEGYKDSVEWWLIKQEDEIDDDNKKQILKKLFISSSVAMIYGAAGTGKTTLINYISKFFAGKKKLYLSNTNPAVENLRHKVNISNSDFATIASMNKKLCYDILIIDECSTVSNQDMAKVLNSINFDLLILVGDIYQIESIYFGNWFKIARYFIPSSSIFELTKPFRTEKKELLDFWQSVRNIKDDMISKMVAYDFTKDIDNSIFCKTSVDEIVLCLNYDGLYGVNNINKFLQSNNPNKEFVFKLNTYRVGDPILFNDSNRFSPLLHNNLKGSIYNIDDKDDKIIFQIILNKSINEFDVRHYDGLKYIGNDALTGKSIIEFNVRKEDTSDEDIDTYDNIMPFQVAYAVSIHKAQGLEYDSVKIVIMSDSEEKITHNIFYTAITRSKNNLVIYWTPETMNKIMSSFEEKDSFKDACILANKFGLKAKKK